MEVGEIYLVNFPFSDISTTKKRPALLIAKLSGDNNIFLQISTKSRTFTKFSINLLKSDCIGEIRFDSFIYCDMIFSLHNSLIIRKIGNVNENKIIEVKDKLKVLFNL